MSLDLTGFDPSLVIWYLAVMAFGGAVGLAELLSRYRDAPVRAVRSRSAFVYILVNALAGGAALHLTRVFDWHFGVEAIDSLQVLWVQTLVAGFGAMAVFRSALFTVRIGDREVAVGPQGFLQVILDVSDQGVDRERAGARADEVGKAMSELVFERAHVALPTLCLALMQNLPVTQQAALGEEVKKLRESNLNDNVKSLVLGLKLMNVVGHSVLIRAIESLGSSIYRAVDISLSPPTGELVPGVQEQLVARATDAFGRIIPRSMIKFTSADESVFLVDSNGKLTAVRPGTTLVTAELDGQKAITQVRVIERRNTEQPVIEEQDPMQSAAGPSDQGIATND